MPARRKERKPKGRKPIVQHEPTPPPPPEWSDTDEEEEDEEDEGGEEHEQDSGKEKEIRQYDPQSLEDEDIVRVLMNVWQSLNQLPNATRQLHEFRRSQVGLTPMLPSTGSTSAASSPVDGAPQPPAVQHTFGHSTIDFDRILNTPFMVVPPVLALPVQSTTPHQPSAVTPVDNFRERRSGLRSKDKIRLTERAQKLYRH